jgi:hypothetical protein
MRVLSVVSARKHSHNNKVSNITREHTQEMAYYCATPVAEKLFKIKDMLVRYRVIIVFSVTNATNSSLILNVYISIRPKTMVRPTNVMFVRN